MSDNQKKTGIIMHSISGFYYVEAAGFVYECKAKGTFRKDKTAPLVGDSVSFETDGDKGFIVKIEPRKSQLARPPIANIEKLFIVASAARPKPNLFVLDKLSALAVYHHIEPVIVFSKMDLADVNEYVRIYRNSGFRVVCVSAITGEGMDELGDMISSGINAFTGNSGVGKTTLLNHFLPSLQLETNDISEKLGRGRHTTRSVQLYRYNGGLIADTPGFSAVDFEEYGERILKEDLPHCFPEFAPYITECKFFASCSHTVDKGCAVLTAVENGEISRERHESYCRLYNTVKDFKNWSVE